MKKILFILLFAVSANAQIYLDRGFKLPFQVAVSGPLFPEGETGVISPSVKNVGTAFETVWSEPGNYIFPTSAAIMSVASTSANDSSGGSGLRTVEVTCLDSEYNQFKEVVTLNGQTPVPMQKACFRVQGNGMTGLTAGSTGSNEGKIYVGTGTFTGGAPANKYGVMDISTNRSSVGVYTVPARFSFFLTQTYLASFDNKIVEANIMLRPQNGLFVRAASLDISNNATSIVSFAPQRANEKTDIMLTAKSNLALTQFKIILSYFIAPGV